MGVKEWKLLDNTVNELNSWVATDRGAETEQNFSLEKMESTLGELKNIFKEKKACGEFVDLVLIAFIVHPTTICPIIRYVRPHLKRFILFFKLQEQLWHLTIFPGHSCLLI